MDILWYAFIRGQQIFVILASNCCTFYFLISQEVCYEFC